MINFLILEKKRTERGSLILLEFKYETDELGHIIDIHPYETGKGQALIESFMVLANETVSIYLSSHLNHHYFKYAKEG